MEVLAFDELADGYDSTFTETAIGRALRQIVWNRMEHTFRDSHRILELGCGTGEDALHLAGLGASVVATDASARMIGIARRKLSERNTARVEFHCLSMEHLGAGLDGQVFDGVLSNFGAVNCVTDPAALVADVARRLAPGAPLLWVVMGRRVPWEWCWYLAHGRWSKAWRRLDRAGIRWRGLTISYPQPPELLAMLRPWFKVTRVSPLGFALPPSYAAGWLERSPRMLKILTALERLAQRSAARASWSDHYIVEATRLEAQPAAPRGAELRTDPRASLAG